MQGRDQNYFSCGFGPRDSYKRAPIILNLKAVVLGWITIYLSTSSSSLMVLWHWWIEPVKLTHWNKWLEQNGNERQLKRCPHKEISLFTVFMRSFELSDCSPEDSSELFSMSEKRSERACNVFLSGKYFIYRWIWRITFRKDKRNDPISSPAMCMKFGVLRKYRMTSLHFKAQKTIFVLNYCIDWCMI